jgi:hypothetical protein
MKPSPILSIPTGGAMVKNNIKYYISSRLSFFHAEMQGNAAYIRLKVVRPFPGLPQPGAMSWLAQPTAGARTARLRNRGRRQRRQRELRALGCPFFKVSFMPMHSKNTTLALDIFITSIPPMIVDVTTYSTHCTIALGCHKVSYLA